MRVPSLFLTLSTTLESLDGSNYLGVGSEEYIYAEFLFKGIKTDLM